MNDTPECTHLCTVLLMAMDFPEDGNTDVLTQDLQAT